MRDIEAQVRTGKVQNIPAYVVKTLQNEFGEIVEDSKVYSPPESIRQQLPSSPEY